jgi:hypothetical protein
LPDFCIGRTLSIIDQVLNGNVTQRNQAMKTIAPFLPVVLIVICCTWSRADILFYEAFDYTPASTVSGQGGWSGSANITVNSDSLSFGDLVTSGNSAGASAGGTIDINTGLTLTPSEGVRWVSAILFQGVPNFREQTIILMSGANEMIRFGNPGQFNPNSLTMGTAGSFGFFNDGDGPSTPATFNTGVAANSTPTAHFFALKYDYDNTAISFYYNPTPGAAEGTLTPLGTIDGVANNLAPIHMGLTGIRVRGNNLNAANAVAWDEIRIGDTWADVAPVVPEPSVIGLLLIGGLTLRGMKRKWEAVR